MKSSVIVFIGIKEYDNLGLGYMSAVLREKGFKTRTIDINCKRSYIIRCINNLNPILIGFSVIYLHHLNQFRNLAAIMSKAKLKCHFTAGGHFASFKYQELMEMMPELDSVVRFEGENTILELASALRNNLEWRNIKGIAFRDGTGIISNELRPFEQDLDKFPFPVRSAPKIYAFWKRYATIIAGRGCTYKCSFCNTGSFYEQGNGKAKRLRDPRIVVREMEMLYRKKNYDVFLFLDDDFPVSNAGGTNWINEYIKELDRGGLSGKIIWKISCRPDEINYELFRHLKKHGLFNVFLGLEDGTDEGLRKMNKKITASDNLNAVSILKKLRIRFNFGFMLFHPYTTFKTLNNNIDFLYEICKDGYVPVSFLKMLPFYETKIERDLKKEGRLISRFDVPDYEFLESAMNGYYKFICKCTDEWLYSPHGFENKANWAYSYISVCEHFFSVKPYIISQIKGIRKTVADSNKFLLDSLKELSCYFENEWVRDEKHDSFLSSYKEKINNMHSYYRSLLGDKMARLISAVEVHQLKNFLMEIDKISAEIKLY